MTAKQRSDKTTTDAKATEARATEAPAAPESGKYYRTTRSFDGLAERQQLTADELSRYPDPGALVTAGYLEEVDANGEVVQQEPVGASIPAPTNQTVASASTPGPADQAVATPADFGHADAQERTER